MSQFDEIADAYEAMIDWDKRLSNEEPLLRWCIEATKAQRVLDAACGTGRHAERLASWGLEVEGADISEAMLAAARRRLAGVPSVTLLQRGFDSPVRAAQSFDLVLCVGNSLALAPTAEVRRKAIAEFIAAVRPGGGVLLHVMNLWRLPEGPTQWQKTKLAGLPAGQRLLLKGVHRCGRSGHIDLVVADPATGSTRADAIEFHGITCEELREWANTGGAASVQFFGDYARRPYEEASSQDLIAFIRR